jgi:hypothetical protein
MRERRDEQAALGLADMQGRVALALVLGRLLCLSLTWMKRLDETPSLWLSQQQPLTTWHSCRTRRPDPMIGACEKTKMRQPSEAGWSTMVFSNQASWGASMKTSWEVYLGRMGRGGEMIVRRQGGGDRDDSVRSTWETDAGGRYTWRGRGSIVRSSWGAGEGGWEKDGLSNSGLPNCRVLPPAHPIPRRPPPLAFLTPLHPVRT